MFIGNDSYIPWLYNIPKPITWLEYQYTLLGYNGNGTKELAEHLYRFCKIDGMEQLSNTIFEEPVHTVNGFRYANNINKLIMKRVFVTASQGCLEPYINRVMMEIKKHGSATLNISSCGEIENPMFNICHLNFHIAGEMVGVHNIEILNVAMIQARANRAEIIQALYITNIILQHVASVLGYAPGNTRHVVHLYKQ